MAQRTSQGLWMGVAPLPSGTAQPALPLAEALGRCNPDQPAPSPALAKEDVLYATRPKPPAQRIRATRSRCNPDQRAPTPALAKEDVLYAPRPKPPAQRIRATRSQQLPPRLLDACRCASAARDRLPVSSGRYRLPHASSRPTLSPNPSGHVRQSRSDAGHAVWAPSRPSGSAPHSTAVHDDRGVGMAGGDLAVD